MGQDVFVKFRLKLVADDEPARGNWIPETLVDYHTVELTPDDAYGPTCYVPKMLADKVFSKMKPQVPAQVVHVHDIAGDKWVLKHSLDQDKKGHRLTNWTKFVGQRGLQGGSKMVLINKEGNLTVGFKNGGAGAHPPLWEARRAVNSLAAGFDAEKAVVRYFPIAGEEYDVLKSVVDEAADLLWQENMMVIVGQKTFRVMEVGEDDSAPLLTLRRNVENPDPAKDSHARPWKATLIEE